MSWQDDWRKWVRRNTARHAAAGVSYPINADDPISEIVAKAMMSNTQAPEEYASEEGAA